MESWVLDKIRQAKAERWQFLDLGNAGLTELPPELLELDKLERLNLSSHFYDFEIGDWRETENYGDLNAIAVWPNAIGRLSALAILIAWGQPCQNVAPLAELANLTTLYLNSTPVSDVAPLAELANLTTLYLSSTPVSDIGPLARLANLTTLYLSSTSVSDVAPLAGLANLTRLYLNSTPVSDVAPLAELANLTMLTLSFTPVSDVASLAELANLTTLYLSSTPVSDVAPLAGLANLTKLYLGDTQVSDVAPLAELANLTTLDLQKCQLRILPLSVIKLPKLEELYLSGSPIADCPTELLGDAYENCLGAVRTHIADQAAGKIADRELKLILLGNGRVGKSSIARRLIQDDFDPDEKSTHAIRLEEWMLDMAGGETRVNVWDFGGQDIYHGTHALFLKSRAVFVIVWDRLTEQQSHYEADGLTFEHLPLAYWLDYVRAVSPHAAVIVVENKCDDGLGSSTTAKLGGLPLVPFSAQEGHGREALLDFIKQAAQRVLGQTAAQEIGIGRWTVKKTLRDYQRKDEQRKPAKRLHRRLIRPQFDKLCAKQKGKISSADELLKFLHNTGVVYYEPKLFHGDIILDQRWAIEAIYTLFHRKKCYSQLLKKHGRFTLNDLHDLAWGSDPETGRVGFTPDEQRLFLSFMQSCSLCFRISEWQHNEDPREVVYLAPELLPDRETLRSDIKRWTRPYDESAGTGSIWFRYRHRFLHQGVMQRFLVRVGELFRNDALYWKDGVLLESSQHRALAEIECHRKLEGNPARGEIVLHVRGHGHAPLLNELRNELERLHDAGTEVEQHASLDGAEWIDLEKLPDALLVGQIVSDQRGILDVQPFRLLQNRDRDNRLTGPYDPEPPHVPAILTRPAGNSRAVFLSYAWGDPHETGDSREAIVDRLYESLLADKYDVRRDKKDLTYKGLISEYMEQIGRGACIVTVISDKYLHSPYCMWELFLIHQHSAARGDFQERIHPIFLPDARIHTTAERLKLVTFWQREVESLSQQAKQVFEALGPDGAMKDIDRYRKIASSVDPLLAFVADMNTLNPSMLEDNNFTVLKAEINERLKNASNAG